MTDRDASDALHARVRAIIEAFARQSVAPESFEDLARDIARYQTKNVPGYARLCDSRGIDPRAIERASELPAVPTEAFKIARVFAFADGEAKATFRTSGTTVGARGAHRMRDPRTYAAAARTFGRFMLARDLAPPIDVLVLGPSDEDAPDSSLAFMCNEFVRAWGRPVPSDETFFVRCGAIDLDGLRARISALSPTQPVVLLATSFALVHLVDSLGDEQLSLPPRSRVMQTGGYKGRSREVSPDALRHAVAKTCAVDPRAVIAEYGMTELSSQFWEATLVDSHARPGVYVEPPWARVVPVDPETLRPVSQGVEGIARVEDLANVDSAFAVLAQDRVRRVDGGFELLGRRSGAPARGCSIALDELLGTPRASS
jgi:hypothetical protein